MTSRRRHAAVDLAVRHAGVIALAELVVEQRVGHRVDQAGEQVAVVGDDVAIVQRDRLRLARCQGVAHAVPDVAALADLSRRQVEGLELGVEGPQAWSVVPQYAVLLRQVIEEGERMPVFRFARPVETNDDLREVGDLLERVHDLRQCRCLQLGVQGRQDQRHGPFGAKRDQLTLDLGQRAVGEFVQGGDDAVLVKIRHEFPSGASYCGVRKWRMPSTHPLGPLAALR